jgi:hypothetical protein
MGGVGKRERSYMYCSWLEGVDWHLAPRLISVPLPPRCEVIVLSSSLSDTNI